MAILGLNLKSQSFDMSRNGGLIGSDDGFSTQSILKASRGFDFLYLEKILEFS